MKRMMMAGMVFVVAGSLTLAADTVEKARKDLQGEYTLKAGMKGGKEISENEKSRFEKAVIKDDVITIHAGGRAEPAKFTIDPSKSPAHFNVIPEKGNMKELPGIYKLEKGVLTIVITRGEERPTDFSGESEQVMKMVLEKKEK